MSKAYFKSKDIKVFPCSYRGYKQNNTSGITDVMFDPEARMMTEQNYLNSSYNVYGKNDSYILNYADINAGDYLEVVIKGYYFKINNFNSYINANWTHLIIALRDDISIASDYNTTVLKNLNNDTDMFLDITTNPSADPSDPSSLSLYEFKGIAMVPVDEISNYYNLEILDGTTHTVLTNKIRLNINLADLNAESGHIITSADNDVDTLNGTQKAITGNKEFKGNVSIIGQNKTLTVTEAVDIDANVDITGQTDIHGDTTITGTTTLNGNFNQAAGNSNIDLGAGTSSDPNKYLRIKKGNYDIIYIAPSGNTTINSNINNIGTLTNIGSTNFKLNNNNNNYRFKIIKVNSNNTSYDILDINGEYGTVDIDLHNGSDASFTIQNHALSTAFAVTPSAITLNNATTVNNTLATSGNNNNITSSAKVIAGTGIDVTAGDIKIASGQKVVRPIGGVDKQVTVPDYTAANKVLGTKLNTTTNTIELVWIDEYDGIYELISPSA